LDEDVVVLVILFEVEAADMKVRAGFEGVEIGRIAHFYHAVLKSWLVLDLELLTYCSIEYCTQNVEGLEVWEKGMEGFGGFTKTCC
jgi:hypothetical protein